MSGEDGTERAGYINYSAVVEQGALGGRGGGGLRSLGLGSVFDCSAEEEW